MLDDLNKSELLLLAEENVPNVHRGLSWEELRDIALGEEVELPDKKVNKLRLKIMQFVNAHFEQVAPFAQACPAKTRNPRACFQCTDVQVAECALTNPIIFNSK